jgi:hypothetical protein
LNGKAQILEVRREDALVRRTRSDSQRRIHAPR